jgi:ribosomal protein L16 Arg81 hydroxylase
MLGFDFGYLIAPHAAADFLVRHWEKSALLIKRDEPDRFHALLPAADINGILSFAEQLPADAVELIGKANAAAHEPGSSRGVAEFFRHGSTIRIRGIQTYWDSLKELCRSLEEQLGFPTRANLYCTAANSRGFDLHFDTHEVLVLQLVGKKRWQVYQPAISLPLEGAAVPGPLKLDELLAAGDSLYLPRGFFHQAAALGEPSVHLTIGIHVLTERSVVNERTADLISGQHDKSGGPNLELLDHETKLAASVGLQVYFSADGSMAGLALGQEVFWMPACFAAALRFVAERQLFCPRELPGEITGNSKLSLVRRLVEDGFLRLAE